MAMITWTKKKFKQIYQYRTKGTYCGYMGDYKKIKKQHSFRRQQLPCSAQSAQMAGYFSLSTTGPSKGVLFFNFFMVSHVATICTVGPILVDLLELFFGSSNHCHQLCDGGPIAVVTRSLLLVVVVVCCCVSPSSGAEYPNLGFLESGVKTSNGFWYNFRQN